jgi:hypothetical protein
MKIIIVQKMSESINAYKGCVIEDGGKMEETDLCHFHGGWQDETDGYHEFYTEKSLVHLLGRSLSQHPKTSRPGENEERPIPAVIWTF